MGRPERPADTRDFYTPALGARVTTGAATWHPATYGPVGGTAAVVRQTHRRFGCHARTGRAHGPRLANYVPPPRPPRLGPQRTRPPTRGQPQQIPVPFCGDKPPQSKCVVSRDTMVRSGTTAHTAPQTAVLRWPWAAPVCWLFGSPMQPGRRIPQPSQFPAGVPLRARVGDLAFASLHSSQGPIPMAVAHPRSNCPCLAS